jgi:hypothetical protein
MEYGREEKSSIGGRKERREGGRPFLFSVEERT